MPQCSIDIEELSPQGQYFPPVAHIQGDRHLMGQGMSLLTAN
jgi:hypothetical protein